MWKTLYIQAGKVVDAELSLRYGVAKTKGEWYTIWTSQRKAPSYRLVPLNKSDPKYPAKRRYYRQIIHGKQTVVPASTNPKEIQRHESKKRKTRTALDARDGCGR